MARLESDACRNSFAAARIAHLATADEGGQPHVVPVTFAVLPDAAAPTGAAVVVAVDHKPKTTTRLRRLRNLTENPRAALLVDHYEDDWTRLWWVRADVDGAEVRPLAEQDTPAGVRGVSALDALVAKYPAYAEHQPDGPLLHLPVARWSGWTAGA
ncbi:TIGR03668 family PPOX class F420-dependent oxidoreductase [Georgenia deserti]|uniref:TIGR03668 family PPOX class F420-dependent oxidoreductase n=1 Tax=Georgenia deserti TaxID=2093781 RepID=A0ABW4L3K8_9MICO